ncbi:PREDICTED: glycine-rich RNA-binding protein 4, mitochondrial [Tarenaya hassleriana]|uniref:glycine-rich RNA-binding protein 4, mitochondrial n=1 Tax=Tarenaya hassleriana TaxID=28532 RepID=UPI00053C6DC2|nr:PREDICTED: glycine-rich RNA-binding protein 4, mitochondrial [Tarenaya hassleriana]
MALSRIVGGHLKSVGVFNSSAAFLFSQRRGVASKLFVGGLSFYTSEQGLSEAFSQSGQVVEAKIIMDRVSDRSKGFGFVTFASDDEAQKAITEMNGKQLNGRVIFVGYAKPKQSFRSGMPIARGPPHPVVAADNDNDNKDDNDDEITNKQARELE